MITATQGGYEVHLPELGIAQPFDPDTRLPFATEEKAKAFEDGIKASIEETKVAHQGELDAQAAAQAIALQKAEIVASLAKIDADTTKPRTLRELALGDAGALAWVADQNTKAVDLRAKLKALDGEIK